MDPETRKVHATMLLIRRVAVISVSTFLTLYILYAVLGSGYDCEAEAKLVQERAFLPLFQVFNRKYALLGGSGVCWLNGARRKVEICHGTVLYVKGPRYSLVPA